MRTSNIHAQYPIYSRQSLFSASKMSERLKIRKISTGGLGFGFCILYKNEENKINA
jgi:hypothetical protein